jgi:hypothetical protein
VARNEIKGRDAERPGVERKRLEREERAASSVYGPTPDATSTRPPVARSSRKARTRTRPVAASRTKASGGTKGGSRT